MLALVSNELRQKLGEALLVIMILGFLVGVLMIIAGAVEIKRGGGSSSGKDGILAGIIIAGAPTIMYALYNIFGLGGATVTF